MKKINLLVFSIVATVLLCGGLLSVVQATDGGQKDIASGDIERERNVPEDEAPILYDGGVTDGDEPVYTTQGNNTLTGNDDIVLDSTAGQEEAARLSSQEDANSTLAIVSGVLFTVVLVAAIGVVYYHKRTKA